MHVCTVTGSIQPIRRLAIDHATRPAVDLDVSVIVTVNKIRN
jgi:hypothetical protein